MGEDICIFSNNECIIFAEAQSKPTGWDARWNRGNYRVAWGYTPGMVLMTFRSRSWGKITATVDGKEVNSPVTLARGKSIVFTAITDWSVKEWTLNGAIVNGTNTTYTYTNRSETETSTAEVTAR
jgi:molybdopterin-binding protein